MDYGALYHVTGALNTAAVALGVYGVWLQVRRIRERRRSGSAHPTEILSLNNFATLFVASWSFFVYGYSIEPFNHVLVWPRLANFLLALVVLYEIQRDRRDGLSIALFIIATVLALAGLAGLAFAPVVADDARLLSQTLIVLITVLVVQANMHQAALIWRSGKTGAVSIRMHQFFLAMDATGILFGFAMGIGSGWPLVLLSAGSAIPKLIILWLFRWVRSTSTDPAAGG